MATPNPEPEFVRQLAAEYKCSICTNLRNTPVLTECCGQHFSRYCLQKWITEIKTIICPHCRRKRFKYIVSQPIIRKIKELQVYCTNSKNGCKEILSYGAFQEHASICPFEVVTCTKNCKKRGLLKKDLEQHHRKECSNRIVICSYCHHKGMHWEVVGNHTKSCPDWVLECPNKCGEKVKRKDIEQHREECPLEVVECPFKEAGCEVSLPRKDLPDHKMTAIQNHLRLTMSNMVTKESHQKLKQSHDELNQSHKELKQSHEELTTSHSELNQNHKELKLKLDNISSVVSKELSSLDTGSMVRQPIASIQTTLTSLTTMIQPDAVHISNELGMCRESEQNGISDITASSPLLWIHPGFKLYLGVIHNNAFCTVMLKSPTHDYPDNLSMQVQLKTGSLHTIVLNKYNEDMYDFRVMIIPIIRLDVQDRNDFFINVTFKQL